MGMDVKRFDVYLISLDPTQGYEMQKTRPCVVISPDEMNRHLGTVIIAPLTTRGREYPSRVSCQFEGKDGQIVLDQIRAVDKSRFVKHLGTIPPDAQRETLTVLQEMFAP